MSWHKFKRNFPMLRVSVNIEMIPKYTDVRYILNSEMPLRELYFWTGFWHPDHGEWQICDTLDYITRSFARTLGKRAIKEYQNEIIKGRKLLKPEVLICQFERNYLQG